MLQGFAGDSRDEHLNEINTRWYEHHIQKENKKEEKANHGRLCQMGQMYGIIHPDFEVTRCCTGYHGRDSGVQKYRISDSQP